MSKLKSRKIGLIGAGSVGMSFAFALQISGLAQELVIIDKDEKRLKGEILDLNHGLFFVPPVTIRAGNYSHLKDASVIVITAGAKQKPGQTRLELVKQNVLILKDIINSIKKHNKNALLIIVSNPVDVLTYYAQKFYGKKVMGSGTVLDSARFRYLISRHCNVDARNVHSSVIGEHGDSEVSLWSRVNISGVLMDELCGKCKKKCSVKQKQSMKNKITQDVKNSAYHIIENKGSTYYAVALALIRILKAVLRDENSMLTVSAVLNGEYGIKDAALSVPCVVNKNGIDKIIETKLSASEMKALKKSAAVIKKSIKAAK